MSSGLEAVVRTVLGFFRTRPDAPLRGDAAEIARVYERKRRLVFWSLVAGYSFFYVCRLGFSVAKKPLLDAHILNAEQMGWIGWALLLTYAFGKLINGFLADRSHVGRFIATGLLASAGILVVFGFTEAFWVFLVLWGINGWFQAMGAAPSGASISQWFSNRERGTRYGIWSTAHSLGEAATFYVTAAIIAWWGWQWGFWSAGGVSIVVAIVLYFTLADRPQTYGLPAIADYRNDHTEESAGPPIPVRQAQWEVVTNPYVWILGCSCAAMYVARYGINNWGMLYLQEDKGYSLVAAGSVLSVAKIVETLGALTSGFISDFLFKARRNVVTLVYGLIEVAGLVILFWGPSTFLCTLDLSYAQHLHDGAVRGVVRAALDSEGISIPADVRVFAEDGGKAWRMGYDAWYLRWKGYRIEASDTTLIVRWKYHPMHLLGMSMFGFGLGGLLVFLGGLIAIDISSKRASGAAMGMVGMFSYLGASLQDLLSGHLLEAGKMVVNGQEVHNFTPAVYIWLGAAIFAVLLSCTLWNAKAKD